MDTLLTIGEFSKMTYLSVKALRHYHDVGLLEPTVVDRATGYRRYSTGQVAAAQAIRRFRDLDMPLDDVRTVLSAPDEATRNRTILAHLERMQAQLDQTQSAVASLQSLLTGSSRATGPVDIRRLPAQRALTMHNVVSLEEVGAWLESAFGEMHVLAERDGLVVVDSTAALYPDELFEAGSGEVIAVLPVDGEAAGVVELAATTVAVLRHEGPFDDLDQAYGALGTYVAERGIAGPGPIREMYITPTSTDVCWPVTTGA